MVPLTGAELFTLSAIDIDGDSDGDSINYSLSASDDSLVSNSHPTEYKTNPLSLSLSLDVFHY